VRVLYVNHTAAVSGAEISLLALLEGLRGGADGVDAAVATPRGQLLSAVEQLGIPTTPIIGTAGSLRLHPLHTPRTVLELSAAAWQLRRAAAARHAEVVHANSIRAGIMLGLARPRGTVRVVHVRDCLPPGRVTSATMRLIAASATVVVANSRYTARTVTAAAPGARVEVVHNPVDLRRWDPARIDREWARARLGEAGGRRLLIGVLAQLSPWKGQDTAIEALRLLRDEGIDAHLLLIGSAKFLASSTRFDNRDYVERLRATIAAAGLQERVSWLGEREDAPELVRALDALLLPSWEEPFGRAVIEGMAMRTPVLATAVGGPSEIITDGREGYLLAPREPRAWAQAIARIAADPELARRMGVAGRETVARGFTVERHVASMIELYRRAGVAGDRAAGPGQDGSEVGRSIANLEKSPHAP
jgi:L-malate glycosyltransferase